MNKRQNLVDIAAEHGDCFYAKIPRYNSFDDDTNKKIRKGVLLYRFADHFRSDDVGLTFVAEGLTGPRWVFLPWAN